MPEPIFLAAMDDFDFNSAFAAQDAAEALNALGLPVQAAKDESETWRIGYFVLTDADLMSLAARHGFVPASEQVH